MKTIILTIFTAILLTFTGCVQAPTDNTENPAAKKNDGKIVIGFSMDTLKEHWVKDRELVEQYAKEMGAEVIVNVANSNDDLQLKQVDNFLTQGVDVLIIAPHNGQVMATAVERAKKQGVPVVAYDRLIKSDDVDVVVSHLHSLAGEMQAKYALEKAPNGNYIMIYGASTDNNAQIMEKSQKETLKSATDSGKVKIVAEQNATNWSPEEALKIAENALTQNSNNVVAIIASNDGMAGGAIQALNNQGLKGKVVVTGMDAQIDALQRIASGEQSMTVYKPIQPLAKAAVEAAVKLAKGEKPETSKTMMADKKEIPFIFIEPKVVEKGNLIDVINDGYAEYDEVFRNIPENERPKKN